MFWISLKDFGGKEYNSSLQRLSECLIIEIHLLIVKIEDALHHVPLLIARSTLAAFLELAYHFLPLSLSREGGEFCHFLVPIEIYGSIHNHHQAVAEDVNLHLQDTHLSDSVTNLLPLHTF